MYINVGKFKKQKDGMYQAPVELDKEASDILFRIGLRLLISQKKLKVMVLTPEEAKKSSIKAKKSVEIEEADYNSFIVEAMMDVIKQAVKKEWKPKKSKI